MSISMKPILLICACTSGYRCSSARELTTARNETKKVSGVESGKEVERTYGVLEKYASNGKMAELARTHTPAMVEAKEVKPLPVRLTDNKQTTIQ